MICLSSTEWKVLSIAIVIVAREKICSGKEMTAEKIDRLHCCTCYKSQFGSHTCLSFVVRMDCSVSSVSPTHFYTMHDGLFPFVSIGCQEARFSLLNSVDCLPFFWQWFLPSDRLKQGPLRLRRIKRSHFTPLYVSLVPRPFLNDESSHPISDARGNAVA